MLKISVEDSGHRCCGEYIPIRLRYTSSEDAPADSLSVRVGEISIPEDAAFCRVLSDGKELFCGGIDELTEHRSGGVQYTGLKARTAEAVLLDNEAVPQYYCMPSFGLLFERYFKPLGFMSYSGDDKIYNGELAVTKGMSVWRVLSEFCRRFTGTRPYIDSDGIIDISGADRSQSIHISAAKILSVTDKYKRSALVSDIYARTYNSGGYNMHFEGKTAAAAGIKRQRYINAVGRDAVSISGIRELLEKNQQSYRELEIVCAGTVWCRPFDKLTIEGMTERFSVREITVVLDGSGTKTYIKAGVTENVA